MPVRVNGKILVFTRLHSVGSLCGICREKIGSCNFEAIATLDLRKCSQLDRQIHRIGSLAI